MIIQPIVVVYNLHCSQSSSIDSLLKQNCKPIIVDNSTSDYANDEYCRTYGLTYLSMKGNAGLTKAYNKALEIVSRESDYLIWLDDDTILPDDYIDKITYEIKRNHNCKVFVPVVASLNADKTILSPSLLINMFTIRVNSIEEIGNQRYSAINSGMIVSKEIYDNYKYDEGLFLDCVDHDFMVFCWNNKVPIKIMDNVVLFQRFSGDEKDSKRSKLNRYKIYAKDFRLFRGKYGCSRLKTEYILIKRWISIIVK